LVCYADDTLVLAGGRWWNETVNLTEDAVTCVVHAIRRLGMSVSPAKSGPCGSSTMAAEEPLLPDCPSPSTGRKCKWETR
jgi:hypothetical protein